MKRLMGCHLIIALVLSLCFTLSIMAQEKKETEGVYTIKKGDTLWDITAKFLKDPFLWPKLWQRNPYITNPHWIYPGNTVRLSAFEEAKKEEPHKPVEEKPREVKEVKPEAAEVKEVKKVGPPPVVEKKLEAVVEKKLEVIAEKQPVEEKKVIPEIRSAGFIAAFDYKGIGVVLDNKEGKNLMAEGDVLYLAFKTAETILIGNKYTIFRASDIIRDTVTEKKIGRKYSISGNIEIIDQFGNFYTARVLEAFDAIYKGDMIQPYSKERMKIEVKR
ncbi:MAG: LysM peptidoglycan-binding domain-containing protein [Deltaproteobacteria bacterium]|nr:LysM peptidoglycan-binding domain-containing protein [Deltaproteobacteria bacterium]